jgi:hypothetical protein
MADALDLRSSSRNGVWVRVPPCLPMYKVKVAFVDLFTGDSIDVGIFTCTDPDPTVKKVSLEILPAAFETNDEFLIAIFHNMKKKIDAEFLLTELIRTNTPYSSLQYYKI